MPRQIDLNVNIQSKQALSNMKQLQSAADQLQKTLAGLGVKSQNPVEKTTQGYKKAANEAAAYERAIQRLGTTLGTLNKSQASTLSGMSSFVRTQEGLNNAVLRATGITRNAAGTFQTFSGSVKAGRGTVETFKLSVDTATGAVYKLDTGLKSTSHAFQGLGTSVASTMKQIVGFTGAAQMARSALTEMKAMSDELVVYQKVTGATAQELERIRSQSYASGKKYGQSPSDFAASIAEFARAGYGKNASSMADLATKVQLVGDMSAEAASSFLLATDAGYKFGGSVERLNQVINAANVIDNNYATSMSKIAEGITVIAPLASSMHVSIEELMAGLGTITAVTQREGTESARALRALFLNIMGDTTTEIEEGVTWSEKEIKTLNDALNKYAKSAVKAAEASGEVINPMEAIGALAKSYKDGLMTEADIMALVSDLGGKLRSSPLMALIQNWDMYEQMLTQIKTDKTSADREVDVMSKSWSAKLQNLKTSWTELVNSRVSDEFIKGVLDAGTGFLEFSGNLENFIGMAGGATYALKGLAAGLKNVSQGAKFGGFNAWTIGLSAALTAISAIKAAYENSLRESQEAAEKAVENAKKKAEDGAKLQEIYSRYVAIASDGIQEEQGEVEELKTLQEELNGLLGDQATAIDLVNGKYSEMSAEIRKAQAEQARITAKEYKAAMTVAGNNFQKQGLGTKLFNVSNFATGDRNVGDLLFSGNMAMSFDEFADLGSIFDSGDYSLLKPFGKVGAYDKFIVKIDFEKPENAEQVKALLQEVEQLYLDMGNKVIGENGETFGEIYSDTYNEIVYFRNLITESAGPYVEAFDLMNAENAKAIILESDLAGKTFETKEAFDAAVESIIESEKATGYYAEAIREAAKEYANYKEEAGSDGGTDDALENDAKAAKTVADALNDATKAKERFDAAMAVDMSSGLDGYLSIIKTLEEELAAGRVNSAAAHAAYRELLGEEAYLATGGYVPEIERLLNQRKAGAAGSIKEGAAILGAEYKNGDGVVIEGAGVVKLAESAGVKVIDEYGNIVIPSITDAMVSQISEAWSGLPEEMIRSAFLAFEQYDAQGSGTDELIGAAKDPVAENTSATQENTDAINGLTEALGGRQDGSGNQTGETGINDKIPGSNQSATGAGTEPNYEARMRAEEARAEADYQKVQLEAERTAAEAAEAKRLQTERRMEAENKRFEADAAKVAREKDYAGGYKEIEAQIAEVENAIQATQSAKITAIQDGAEQTLAEIEALEIALQEAAAALETEKRRLDFEAELDDDELLAAVENLESMKPTVTVEAKANTLKAEQDIGKLTFPRRVVITAVVDNGTKNPLTNTPPSAKKQITKMATGTRHHPGGLSLVNDGSGPELIAQNGSAFIAGGGNPTLVNLQPGAKVFTASETRGILSGNGVPAYASGTFSNIIGGINTGLNYNDLFNNKTPSSTNKNTNKNNNSDKKEESKETSSSGSSGGGSSSSSSGEGPWENLTQMIDYILNRINKALDEQMETIDKQIEALKEAKEAADDQKELEERQQAVAEAQKDLATALGERTVRYLGADGKWHWMADQRSVQNAQEKLNDAQESLDDYMGDMAFDKQIDELEKQKDALQNEFEKITKVWEEIQEGVDTPTGDLSSIIQSVLSGGSAQEKKGASTVQSLLISSLLQGGIFTGNYSEALDAIAKATSGSPVMPGEATNTLASLIASGGSGDTTGALANLLSGTGSGGLAFGGNGGYINQQTNYNYYIDGIHLGEYEANEPLSDVMRRLTVYGNSGN